MGASTAPHTGARRAKAAATEEALKQAARRVFERQGYLNTKITDITAEAGRATGSFYNHFAGRQELLEALLLDVFATGDEMVAEHPPDHDLSDRQQLRWHVAGFWETFRRHRTVFVAIMQAAMVDERFAGRLREMLIGQQEPLRDHLEYLRDRGIQLPGEPDVLAGAMSGMWFQFGYGMLNVVDRPVSDDEAIDLLTSFTLRGLVGHAPGSSTAMTGGSH